MFNKRPKRLDEQLSLVKYQGIFRRKLTMFQGVALIVSVTIGAGVLGVPYAISKVGIGLGLVYIIGLGILMTGLNLLIGGITVRTRGNLQLVGLANKYLGRVGEVLMIILKYVSGVGILVIYIIGVGKTAAVFLNGSEVTWSLIFFAVGSLLIFNGMRSIKVVDFFLSIVILAVVLLIASFGASSIDLLNFEYNNFSNFLLPYGVILFAFHGGAAIPEVHSILSNRKKTFKSAIIIAGIISITTYLLFTLVVLGVTGKDTTEIATIGLGQAVGPVMLIFGNIFAILAMGTSFLTVGLSLRDSLVWDHKIKETLAALLVCVVPLIVFLLGLRQFIMAIDIVGGIFISLEMLMVIIIYWRAKQIGDLKPGKYRLHHTLLLAVLLILALVVGVIYSVVKLF